MTTHSHIEGANMRLILVFRKKYGIPKKCCFWEQLWMVKFLSYLAYIDLSPDSIRLKMAKFPFNQFLITQNSWNFFLCFIFNKWSGKIAWNTVYLADEAAKYDDISQDWAG